jgi:hypothetical protein
MVIDENVAIYVGLSFKLMIVNLQRAKWMFIYHPFWMTNPISKRLSIRKYERMIEKIQQK